MLEGQGFSTGRWSEAWILPDWPHFSCRVRRPSPGRRHSLWRWQGAPEQIVNHKWHYSNNGWQHHLVFHCWALVSNFGNGNVLALHYLNNTNGAGGDGCTTQRLGLLPPKQCNGLRGSLVSTTVARVLFSFPLMCALQQAPLVTFTVVPRICAATAPRKCVCRRQGCTIHSKSIH